MATPDSAPSLVPLQSEHERLLQHRPAITTLNHPLARRHGPTAARARAAPYHPPVPRRASRDIPTTRAPAGPRPRQVAWCGGRAVHLAPSPTAEITAAAPWAAHERAAWWGGRAPLALRRADGASRDRTRPLLRAVGQGKGGIRRPLYVQFEARPHRGLAGPSPPPTHHLVRSTPARSRSKSTHPVW